MNDKPKSEVSAAPATVGEWSEKLRTIIREEIDRDNAEYAFLVDRLTEERNDARATATRHMEEAEKFKASLEKWKDAEREGSAAYLRIRAIVNAYNTQPGGIDRHGVTERAVQQAVERAALLAPFSQIAERMDGQDNRATADPVFVVQQRRRICGFDTDWCGGNTAWLCEGEEIANDTEGLEKFLRDNELTKEECLENGSLVKTGYEDTYEFVQPFFSMKAAENYIETNRHNLTDPRVYVDSAYRNEEWQAVRGVLLEMIEKGGE